MNYKRLILYFLTSFASIWLILQILSGFTVTSMWEYLILGVVITTGIALTDYILKKIGNKKPVIFIFIGTLINFFVLYLGSLLLPGFNIGAGSLRELNLEAFSTPAVDSLDVILTLLVASFITIVIAWVTNWATQSKS